MFIHNKNVSSRINLRTMKYKKGNRDDIGKAAKEHIVNVRKQHLYKWSNISDAISIPNKYLESSYM